MKKRKKSKDSFKSSNSDFWNLSDAGSNERPLFINHMTTKHSKQLDNFLTSYYPTYLKKRNQQRKKEQQK